MNSNMQSFSLSKNNTKKLFIGSLPPLTTNKDIRCYFSSMAIPVIDIKLSFDYNHKICKGFGFVEIPSDTDIELFLKQEHIILGRKVSCEAYLSGKQLQQRKEILSKRKVFVTNLPDYMSNFQLKRLFAQFGEVEHAYRSLRHGQKVRMSFGYVIFKNPNSAQWCTKQGKLFINNDHGFVYVEEFNSKPKEFLNHDLQNQNMAGHSGLGDRRRIFHFNQRSGVNESFEAASRHPQEKKLNEGWSGMKLPVRRKKTASVSSDQLLNGGTENVPFVEIEQRKILRRKKKLNKRIRKQLDFDNLKPYESAYWTASVKRIACFQKREKVQSCTYKLNWPGQNDNLI